MLDLPALVNRLIRVYDENGWIEFKQNAISPNDLGEYISALANTCILKGQERAYIVFGIEDESRRKIGTNFKSHNEKKGGENLINWLSRMIEPRINIEFHDFSHDSLDFCLIVIEPSYERPVRFSGTEYIRIGENKKKLIDFPEHERALWLATGRRRFENAVALSHQAPSHLLECLHTETIFQLTGEPKPKNENEIIKKLITYGFVNDCMDGYFDVTNLGAILLAYDLDYFPSIKNKSIRLVKYKGDDKRNSDSETEGRRGYAVGFSNLIRHIMNVVPKEDKYIDGVRRNLSIYPQIAIREIIANALIHQDFTVSGSGPVIEIYDNRIEVTNPGNCLLSTDRIIDERRSRNEKLASIMRAFGLCEERGGGLDKTLIEIEKRHLPAPDFISSENSMRVVIFGPRPWNKMTKTDKIRACFHHCVIRWLTHDYMSNSSLRERFSLEDKDYQAVSSVISEALKQGRIAPAEAEQGRRNARYVPYWAADA